MIVAGLALCGESTRPRTRLQCHSCKGVFIARQGESHPPSGGRELLVCACMHACPSWLTQRRFGDGDGTRYYGTLAHHGVAFARVYRVGVWSGFIMSALLLAVVLCWVDCCLGSWVLLGLLWFLCVAIFFREAVPRNGRWGVLVVNVNVNNLLAISI